MPTTITIGKNSMIIPYRPRLIACSVAIVFLSACSTQILKTPVRVPVYEGPLRSIDEVGVFLPTQLVGLSKVDGAYVIGFKRAEIPFGMGGWEIELLPGMHRLEFDYLVNVPNVTVRSTSPVIKMFNIEAGHIYIAGPADAPKGRWGVDVDDVTERERANLAARRGAASKK
jgi:hypothetical protein